MHRGPADAGALNTLLQQQLTPSRDGTPERRVGGRVFRTLVEAMAGIAAILRQADPTDKAEVYRQLGIKLTYKPGLRLIQAEASPSGSCTKVCPEGDLNPQA